MGMGAGFAALLGSLAGGYAQPAIQKQQKEAEQAFQVKQDRIRALTAALNDPNLPPTAATEAAGMLDQLLQPPGGKGKKKSGNQLAPIVGTISTIFHGLGKPPQPPNTQAQGLAGIYAQRMTSTQQGQQKGQAEGAEQQELVRQREQLGKENGLTGEDLKQFALTGQLTNVTDKQRQIFDERTREAQSMGLTGVDASTFALTGKLPTTTTNPKPPKVLQPVGGGAPYGVMRDGKNVLPGDPGFTDADAKMLGAATKSYQAQQKAVGDRMVQARETYWKNRPMGVYDKDGNLTFATGGQIAASPGDFAPIAGALQTKNRQALFSEIDYSRNQVDQAISALGDQGFSPEARAQMATVLRSTDPKSAFSMFANSAAATTLSPQQVDYVTALVSLAESAMSLRSLGGMGAGSDQLRSAITSMLPGAETPSKEYAQRQMRLFQGEVNQLRKSVPGIPGDRNTGLGGPPPPPGSTVKMKAPNGQTKDVPADQVDFYKKKGATVVQ